MKQSLSIIVNDFFKTVFLLWIILLIFELVNPGMVNRFINLEYYFYFLILVYILVLKIKK
jgi:hypothetical protein